jgi:outer membrane protein OmpA-like peptidoglycan-associated protein
MRRPLTIALLALPLGSIQAQDLVLEGTADDTSVQVRGISSEPSIPYFTAIWRYTPDGILFDMVHTLAPGTGPGLRLDRLMEAALGAFLDRHIHFQKQGVVADDEPDRLLMLMNAMTWAAAEHFGATSVFAGFEAPTRDQLIRFCTIDWSRAQATGIGDETDKYMAIHYYVRSQRQELERQLRADLLPLSAVDVMTPTTTRLSAGRFERINSVCGTVYDADNFLCALDLSVSDSSIALSDVILGLPPASPMMPPDVPTPAAAQPHIRKRDRWLKEEFDAINQRIDRMDQRQELWALRDRIDDLQGQVDDLRLSVQDLEDRTTESDNPIAALSELTGTNVTIRFERYGTTIGTDHLVVLNEVFEQLARSPDDRVLITGYSDRSGDPVMNMRLSEQRAQAVRDHLLERGIGPERLLLNYYGDRFSTGRDPSERRVEIEWLR